MLRFVVQPWPARQFWLSSPQIKIEETTRWSLLGSHSCSMDIVEIVDTVDWKLSRTIPAFMCLCFGQDLGGVSSSNLVCHHVNHCISKTLPLFNLCNFNIELHPAPWVVLTSSTFSAEAHNLLAPQAPRRVVIGANGSKQWGNACDVTRLVSLFWQKPSLMNYTNYTNYTFGCWPMCIRNELNKLQCAAWCICWAASAFSQPLSEVFIQVPLKALTRQEEQRKPPTHRSMGMEGGRIITTCHLGMKMSWWDGTGK